jgi:mannose-6-phosphate isomerase
MTELALYPLRFEAILQARIWGGARLPDWLGTESTIAGPIGEAWVLSDRDDHPSRVADGPLKGRTITQLIETAPKQILGALARRFQRFPLLLKFLDVEKMLSVQVHPADSQADLIPSGETGKTEAWVVLDVSPESRIFVGLKPGATAANLRSLSLQTVEDRLAGFVPTPGQAVLIEAGTVHSLGGGVFVFEVQENSDVTFRLYDWDHVDPTTGRGRPLQVEQALACIDLAQGAVQPVTPVVEALPPGRLERLFDTAHFQLWRHHGTAPFPVGRNDAPRVLVCIGGHGNIEYDGVDYPMKRGAIVLLPAALGECRFRPDGAVTLLEAGVPDRERDGES